MIKTSYTTKLFFGKYNSRVIVVTRLSKKNHRWRSPKPRELQALHTWCRDNLSEDGHIIKDHFCLFNEDTAYQQMVYLSNPADRDLLLAHYGSQISEVTQPLDDSHKQQLEVRNLVVVRESLLYNRFKHCVYFKYDPTLETWRWLKTFFQDEESSKLMPDPKHDASYPVWPRVYLEDDTHLTTLKLMWQERIDYVKTVHHIGSNPKQ